MVHLESDTGGLRSDAARNRRRILEVARQLIAQHGPGVTVDTIASHAGVAVGTIYRHHPTKAALVDAVIADSVKTIADATEMAVAAVRAGAPAGEELARVFRLVAERHAVDQSVKQAASTLGAHDAKDVSALTPGSPAHDAWQAIQELLAAAQRQAAVRSDLTPTDLLALLSGVPGIEHDAAIRSRYIDIVLTGIAKAPDCD
jgi:AcrR family transcriptional regulator